METKTPKELRNALLGQSTVKALKNRNFDAYYCENSKEALQLALSLIPSGSSVSWGGSMTLRDIGLTEALNSGDFKAYDRDKAPTPEQYREILKKALTLDCYVTSTNAISSDGMLINIDGTGNRLAALCYGPDNVIVVSGINKVCSSESAAMERARTYAAPINQLRFMGNTPCSKTGECANCKTDQCICRQILTTRMCHPPKRIKVILIGEELGY